MRSSNFLFLFTMLMVFGSTTGCQSTSLLDDRREKNKAHPAAYTVEGFSLENRMPEARPLEKHEFYYKHCELIGRRAQPSRSDYECTEPD